MGLFEDGTRISNFEISFYLIYAVSVECFLLKKASHAFLK